MTLRKILLCPIWVFPHALANYLCLWGGFFVFNQSVALKNLSQLFSAKYIYIYVYTNTEELDYTLYYELTYMYPSLKNSYEQRV